jgi:hypothetical protein
MKSFIQLLLALFTLAFMIWLVWQGVGLLRINQLGLTADAKPVVVIGALLVMICTFAISNALSNHGDKVYRSAQVSNRIILYEKCLALWQVVQQELEHDPAAQVDLGLQELEHQLTLLASPKVLRAYRELRAAAKTQGINADGTNVALLQILLAMREDLGQPADYFARKEIQQLVKITDHGSKEIFA